MRGFGARSDRLSAACACAVVASFALAGPGEARAADAWGNARILYFEKFETKIDPRPALTQKRSNDRLLKFEAYGRELELALVPNATLESVRESHPNASVHLYRGQLTGIEDSWARIATNGSDVHGLIWDGAELYVIESSEAVRDSLIPPLDVSRTKTILFRLSDTIVDAGAALCATPATAAVTGLDSYTALTREFASLKGSPTLMQAANAALRLEISAIGDAQFRAQFASDAAAVDQMLLRLNNVDGIFAAELGVQIQVPTALVYDSSSDPLPATAVATDLLRRLASLRAATPQLKARGLTHLFTGRDLDGSTVGIGYIDSVCNAEFGAALTEVRGRGAWLESLIAAHEIGHNFGAIHDGEEQCSAVPQNEFLMSPTVHASKATFSSCSRDRMMRRLASASCITALPPADLAIAADLGALHEGIGRMFEWELPITNVGGRTTQQARIEVLVPSSIDIIEAWIPGGTCTSGAGVIDCELGSIAGGVTRALHLTLNGRTTGSSAISARIVAPFDAKTGNNEGSGTIAIDPQLDLGITLHAPAAVLVGDALAAQFTVSNAAPDDARSISIALQIPTHLRITNATLENGSCDVQALTCTVPVLASGSTIEGSIDVSARAAGSGQLSVRVSAHAFDPNSPNDVAAQTIVVSTATSTAESAAAATPRTSGGGGAFGLGFAAALLLLLGARRR